LLPANPIGTATNSSTVTITEPSHGRNIGDVIELRNVDGSPGGLAFYDL